MELGVIAAMFGSAFAFVDCIDLSQWIKRSRPLAMGLQRRSGIWMVCLVQSSKQLLNGMRCLGLRVLLSTWDHLRELSCMIGMTIHLQLFGSIVDLTMNICGRDLYINS